MISSEEAYQELRLLILRQRVEDQKKDSLTNF
jgi:hypothetical protein